MKFIAALMVLAAAANAATSTTSVPTLSPADVLIFVSQATFLGDGTQAAMDAACWQEGSGSTIGQEFRAAIANQFGTTPRPYNMVSNIKGQVVNTNGEVLAANIDALWPQGPIDVQLYELTGFVLDIDGNPSAEPHAWTGSASLTTAPAGADCQGWTSAGGGLAIAGNCLVTDANWWNEFFDFCNGDDGQSGIRPNAVYCIQAYQGSAILQDPVFDGFDGSHFEFQGLPNQVFNLISSFNFNLNALFVPIEHGTFMGAAGIKIGENEIYVDGNRTVTLNGELVKSTIKTESFDLIVKESSTVVSSDAFTVEIASISSNRIDIKTFLDTSKLTGLPHGILGQTVANIGNQPKQGQDNMGAGVIEGTYTDYLVQDGLFGQEFEVNRFGVHVAKGAKRSFTSGVFGANAL